VEPVALSTVVAAGAGAPGRYSPEINDVPLGDAIKSVWPENTGVDDATYCAARAGANAGSYRPAVSINCVSELAGGSMVANVGATVATSHAAG
jgi:hypothetical protein